MSVFNLFKKKKEKTHQELIDEIYSDSARSMQAVKNNSTPFCGKKTKVGMWESIKPKNPDTTNSSCF